MVVKVNNLKVVQYVRHEFHGQDERREGTLLTLAYDIPHFSACGVFPPLAIINEIFSSGGGEGGMSPGASWEPFTISEEEYTDLVEAVKRTPVSEIKGCARFASLPMKFDDEFNHIEDRIAWMTAACEKHRDSWLAKHEELNTSG